MNNPTPRLRKLRADRIDLFDANVNGWLRGTPQYPFDAPSAGVEPDPRRFLTRNFLDPDGGEGICRAVLSDSFKRIDNLDVLTAALDGVRQTGQQVEVMSADLSEKRMVVKLVAPGVQTLAHRLLANYRSPFNDGDVNRWRRAADAEGKGYTPGTEPVLFAGFVLSNSETGGGAYTIIPRFVVEICGNGLTITKDAVRNVHLGGKLDEGVVRWSEDTQRRNLELVTAQTRDAVATFLDVDYMTEVIERIEEKSATPLPKAVEQVQVIAQRLKYTQAVTDGVLDHFIKGGDLTAGGVMQAVTSYAQMIEDPDAAWELETSALESLDVAVAVANGR